MTTETTIARTWWTRGRPFSLPELIADGVVHGIGIVVAVALGAVLLAFAGYETAPNELPALVLYVGSLLLVLSISLAFNLCPIASPAKRTLARLDQAAIFLFIAGTYTPFLVLLGATPSSIIIGLLIWGAALTGMALKLFVPHRFGRGAIVLYLGIGWSGVFVFQALASHLPGVALWLLVAGGLCYSVGLIFHLWERLTFHNAVWHGFVVAGASLHLVAVLDCMVISRL
ncbi:hemolysin III family protein [Devosia sp. LjRoot16]|uniref:PAQR family membrane homeostasis protein TrhA n=1 Tax=unclassified Devosia TaxID=196773 RepID=UPI00070064FA|nr:hemolysin III family protein [Devosia sp. Root105]KQU99313.1 DNA-binding protein [Devosia sp. Root105]